jgi:hypothetical protein
MEGYRSMTEAATGKTHIAVKVFDKDCDICRHMSKHDRATFGGFPEIGYQEVLLDDVINHQNNLTKLRIYQLLERYCLSSTYEIDLPVYLIMSSKGDYKGYLQGAATIVELRDKIKECLEDTPE